jgi:DDE family transposase
VASTGDHCSTPRDRKPTGRLRAVGRAAAGVCARLTDVTGWLPRNARSGRVQRDCSPPATTICALYKDRWQVELFFKWVKQHLRIKRFYGTSENAVKSQIWIAVSVYVLVAIVKKRLNLDASLYTLLQILSVTLFEKMMLCQAVTGADYKPDNDVQSNQLNLFAF